MCFLTVLKKLSSLKHFFYRSRYIETCTPELSNFFRDPPNALSVQHFPCLKAAEEKHSLSSIFPLMAYYIGQLAATSAGSAPTVVASRMEAFSLVNNAKYMIGMELS